MIAIKTDGKYRRYGERKPVRLSDETGEVLNLSFKWNMKRGEKDSLYALVRAEDGRNRAYDLDYQHTGDPRLLPDVITLVTGNGEITFKLEDWERRFRYDKSQEWKNESPLTESDLLKEPII